MIKTGTSQNETLVGGSGNDTLDGGGGNDYLVGDAGNDTYLVRDIHTQIYDSSGTDSGVVYVDFYKTNPEVENWTWASGVQKLPYWIDALLPGSAPGFLPLLGGSKTMYYAFPTSAPSYFSADDRNGFQVLNSTQKEFVKTALAYISGIIDIQFVETTDPDAPNVIAFANNSQGDSAGYAYNPYDQAIGSDVLLDSYSSNLAPADGNYAALTYIHEIGHALGLKHPFGHVDAVGTEGEAPFLSDAEDSTQWSVMSYTSRSQEYHLRYSPFDIATLQYLYGPSKQAQIDDTYTLHADSANFIWDGGGTDTIDGSTLTQALTLYLEPGYWGYIGSKASTISSAGQITINFGTVIETTKGGSGDDTITGNSPDNRIYGQAGNDTLIGGMGNDVLDGGDGNDVFEDLSERDAIFGGNGSDKLVLSQSSTSMKVTKLRGDVFVVNDATSANVAVCRNIEQIQFSDSTLNLSSVATVANLDAPLVQIYVAAFRRAPEIEGYNYWKNEVAAHGIAAISDTIFSLDIVKAIYSSDISASQFVTTIYSNVFNKEPDAEGLNYWTQQLTAKSRGQLVLDMTNVALNVPDGTSGKDFFQNRLDWSLYAVEYQQEQAKELDPTHLTSLTSGIGADTNALVALIGQAQSGVTI